jgi:hypothetical protein
VHDLKFYPVDRRNDLRQTFTPVEDRFGSKVKTFTPKKVEHIENDWRSGTLLPSLQQLETWDSCGVQGHNFTVQDGRAQVQLTDRFSYRWELRFEW